MDVRDDRKFDVLQGFFVVSVFFLFLKGRIFSSDQVRDWMEEIGMESGELVACCDYHKFYVTIFLLGFQSHSILLFTNLIS